MNKKQAMLEKLKGKQVVKCECGSYMVECSKGKTWTEFKCQECNLGLIKSTEHNLGFLGLMKPTKSTEHKARFFIRGDKEP